MRWLLVCYCMFIYFFINLFLNGFRCVNCVNVLAYLALVKLILISIPRTRPHTHSRPYYRNQSPVPVCFQANKKGDILKLLQLSMFNPKMVKNRPLIPHYHTLVNLLNSLTPTISQTHTYKFENLEKHFVKYTIWSRLLVCCVVVSTISYYYFRRPTSNVSPNSL